MIVGYRTFQGLTVRYMLPARLDDEIQATAAIARLRGAAIIFRQGILRGPDVLAEGEVTVACVDRTAMKPRRLPSEMVASMRALETQQT